MQWPFFAYSHTNLKTIDDTILLQNCVVCEGNSGPELPAQFLEVGLKFWGFSRILLKKLVVRILGAVWNHPKFEPNLGALTPSARYQTIVSLYATCIISVICWSFEIGTVKFWIVQYSTANRWANDLGLEVKLARQPGIERLLDLPENALHSVLFTTYW